MLHFQKSLRKPDIFGSGYFYIGVIAGGHVDLSADSLHQLTVVSEIKTVLQSEVDALKVEVALEYLGSLRYVQRLPWWRVDDKTAVNGLYGVLHRNTQGSAAENRGVLDDPADMLRLHQRTGAVVNGNEF